MRRTAVLNVVGLTEALLGPDTPRLSAFRDKGSLWHVTPAFPALTCTAQANYLTGQPPTRHGIVGNGWYHRELAEVQFWKQSERLVDAPKLWEELRGRDPSFTCAKLFWWYNMYSSADFAVTPRPMYPADGRKVFDIYGWPYSLRTELPRALGPFPFPAFWGPAAGVDSPQGRADAASRWIADAARWIEEKHAPTLSLVYLPHLDYNLQRHGPWQAGASLPAGANRPAGAGGRVLNPAVRRDLREIDVLAGDLIDFFRGRGVQVVVLSEYGLTTVDRPIHLNRLFREQGWLAVKEELGLELLDPGASRAFAVADHQVAHIYLNDPGLAGAVRALLEQQPGVAEVLAAPEKIARHVQHRHAGDFIAVAEERAWFTYLYWLDDRRAPDFARTVDIHRKPGYDPVELFLDPAVPWIKLKILWRLLQKRLGFRMLMDVVPLDATLVRGSHGRPTSVPADQPVLMTDASGGGRGSGLESTGVHRLLACLIEGGERARHDTPLPPVRLGMDLGAPAGAHRDLRTMRCGNAGLPQLPPVRPGGRPAVPGDAGRARSREGSRELLRLVRAGPPRLHPERRARPFGGGPRPVPQAVRRLSAGLDPCAAG